MHHVRLLASWDYARYEIESRRKAGRPPALYPCRLVFAFEEPYPHGESHAHRFGSGKTTAYPRTWRIIRADANMISCYTPFLCAPRYHLPRAVAKTKEESQLLKKVLNTSLSVQSSHGYPIFLKKLSSSFNSVSGHTIPVNTFPISLPAFRYWKRLILYLGLNVVKNFSSAPGRSGKLNM